MANNGVWSTTGAPFQLNPIVLAMTGLPAQATIAAPSNLQAVDNAGDVTLTWTINAPSATSTFIYRSQTLETLFDGASYYGFVDAPAATFVDTDVAQGVWYYGVSQYDSVNDRYSAGEVFAQVVVGGASVNVQHGDSVTITGSGFGTRTASYSFLGGNAGAIEATALSSTPAAAGWNLDSQWSDGTVYNDTTRGKVLRSVLNSTSYNADKRFDYGSDIPENTRYLFSAWVRNVSNMDGNTTCQWKDMRVGATNSLTDNDSEIVYFNWQGAGDQAIVRYDAVGNPSSWPTSDIGTLLDGGWTKMEMFVDTGSQGAADGVVHLRTARPGSTPAVFSITNKTVYGTANRHRYFMRQNYFGNYSPVGGSNASQEVFEDDLYVQVGSWKRVELCNNAVLANATLRETQEVLSWADGSVSIRLNQGGLPAGTYWLHAVDDLETSLGARQVEIIP